MDRKWNYFIWLMLRMWEKLENKWGFENWWRLRTLLLNGNRQTGLLAQNSSQPSLEKFRPCQWGLAGSLLPWKLFAYLRDLGPVHPRPENISSEKTSKLFLKTIQSFRVRPANKHRMKYEWWQWLEGTDVVIRHIYLLYAYWQSIQSVPGPVWGDQDEFTKMPPTENLPSINSQSNGRNILKQPISLRWNI